MGWGVRRRGGAWLLGDFLGLWTESFNGFAGEDGGLLDCWI